MTKISAPLLFLASMALTSGLFVAFEGLLPPVVPCTALTAQNLGLALCLGLGFQLLAAARFEGGGLRWGIGVHIALILLVVWLGFYPLSPLVSSGHIPVLRGFTVLTKARGEVNVAPGAVVTIDSGKPAAVQALTLVTDTRCRWMSAQGGDLEDPQSCATVYIPPQAEYDILKVSMQPACGLPHSVAQIKISIP